MTPPARATLSFCSGSAAMKVVHLMPTISTSREMKLSRTEASMSPRAPWTMPVDKDTDENSSVYMKIWKTIKLVLFLWGFFFYPHSQTKIGGSSGESHLRHAHHIHSWNFFVFDELGIVFCTSRKPKKDVPVDTFVQQLHIVQTFFSKETEKVLSRWNLSDVSQHAGRAQGGRKGHHPRTLRNSNILTLMFLFDLFEFWTLFLGLLTFS